MLSRQDALEFAQEWIEAWNSHDLDRILAHYEDGFAMNSPVITRVMGKESGRLRGKDEVRRYWSLALERNPQLRFELRSVLIGVNSLTVLYDGVRGLSAEVFHFGGDEKVIEAFAHYESPLG